VKEWEKAMSTLETPNCTENLCHACGVCTELNATHQLAQPNPAVMKRNPFVKELSANHTDPDSHPSLFFMKPAEVVESTGLKMRFRLSKTGDLRFISHLDLQTLLTRAARRASLNIAYSKGFNPQPKLSLATALPLFQQSLGEVGELELAENIDEETFRSRINKQLPPEVQLIEVRCLEGKADSLASRLSSAVYAASPSLAVDQTTLNAVQKRIESILSQETVLVAPPASEKSEAPAPPRDIRPGILGLGITNQSPLTLEFEIAHGSKMHVKPSELLGCVQPPEMVTQITWRITRLELRAADKTPLLHI
jgi:radical SAM-linked protein